MKKVFASVFCLLLVFLPTLVSAETLPTIRLELPYPNTFNRQNPIHRDEWRQGTVEVTNSNHNLPPTPVEIRGRGNSSWTHMGDKLPYRFRFMPGGGMPMFGSEHSARTWELVANAMDYSLLRNVSALQLGKNLNFLFTPSAQSVHLYINGNYRGVYILTDRVREGTGRIEVTGNTDPAKSEYHIEFCHHVGRETPDEAVWISEGGSPSPRGSSYAVHFPEDGDLTQAHRQYIQNFMSSVYRSFSNGSYEQISELIDIPSFIDAYIVQEFYKNIDVGIASVHFTIRQIDGKPRLFAGPIWDFDLSSGNCGGVGGFGWGWPPPPGAGMDETHYSPEGVWAAQQSSGSNYGNVMFFRLMNNNQWFPGMVSQRWDEIKDNEIKDMIDSITATAQRHRPCFERNFQQWNVLGTRLWRTAQPILALRTYMENVNYLTNWFERRYAWMDGYLSNRARPMPLVKPPAPEITAYNAPGGRVGIPYNFRFRAMGIPTPTWTHTGNLPTGLTFSNGTLSGTPTTTGSFTFTVRAANGNGADSKEITVEIRSSINMPPPSIIINQLYGQGAEGDNAISHGFIELYNPTNTLINLNDYSLQVLNGRAGGGAVWNVLPLAGYSISPRSYLLVVSTDWVNTNTSPSQGHVPRYVIQNYDIGWDLRFNNQRLTAAIVSGTEPLSSVITNTEWSRVHDLVGAINETPRDMVDNFLGDGPAFRISRQVAARRKDHQNERDNAADFEAIDYRYPTGYANARPGAATNASGITNQQLETYRPRFSGEGLQFHTVTVNGGTAAPSRAAAGTTVTLTATPQTGQEFIRWTVSGGVTLDNANNAVTTFVMGNADVTATAEYTEITMQPKSLLINQIYGQGARGNNAISHGFIELYNPTDEAINLDGWSVQVQNIGDGADVNTIPTEWHVIPLSGTIAPRFSLLVVSDTWQNENARYTIPRWDIVTDIEFSNRNMSAAIVNNTTKLSPIITSSEISNIVDLVGVVNNDDGTRDRVHNFLGTLPALRISRQEAARRISSTRNNRADFAPIRYAADGMTDTELEQNRPRTLQDGVQAEIIFDMQTDPNWNNFQSSTLHPITRGISIGSGGTVTLNNQPRSVALTGRGGTSQGVRLRASALLAALPANNSLRIEYTGTLNIDGTSQIRMDSPSGHTYTQGQDVWTSTTQNRAFSHTLDLTREQLQFATTSPRTGDISLGATPHNANLTITGIKISVVPAFVPIPTPTTSPTPTSSPEPTPTTSPEPTPTTSPTPTSSPEPTPTTSPEIIIVIFDLGAGEFKNSSDSRIENITQGSSIEMLPRMTAMTNPGYRFTGWFDSDGTRWNENTPVNSSVTLYARWERSPDNFKIADINRDGRVTSADATILARYFVGQQDICAYAADLNGDANVTVADLILLGKWLVGQDVEVSV